MISIVCGGGLLRGARSHDALISVTSVGEIGQAPLARASDPFQSSDSARSHVTVKRKRERERVRTRVRERERDERRRESEREGEKEKHVRSPFGLASPFGGFGHPLAVDRAMAPTVNFCVSVPVATDMARAPADLDETEKISMGRRHGSPTMSLEVRVDAPTHLWGDERAHQEFVVFSAVVLEMLCAQRYGAVATR